jgi:hypothetical protein
VELHGGEHERGWEVRPSSGDERKIVALFEEDGIDVALEASPEVGAEVLKAC